jgi:spermidine synthase
MLFFKTFLKSILSLLVVFIIILCVSYIIQKPKILMEKDGLWVYEFQGERCLNFEKPLSYVRQTCIFIDNPEKLRFNYQKIVLGSLYLKQDIKKILMIGMGGGTIATALRKILPEANIDIVEINPIIPQVAEDYFMFKNDPQIKVIIEDGFDFVMKSQDKYDVIIVDAFANTKVPPKFLTEEFLGSAKRILSDDCVIAFNSIMNTDNDLLEKAFYKVFKKLYNITNDSNRVIIAGKTISLEEIKRNAELLRKKFESIGINTDFLLEKFSKK